MPKQSGNQNSQESMKPQNQEAPKHQVGHEMADRKKGRDPGTVHNRKKQPDSGAAQKGSASKPSGPKGQSSRDTKTTP